MANAITVLVVAAHPDDEVLGCGATLAKHAERGDRVRILILGEGVTSRPDLSRSRKEAALRRLRKNSAAAGRILKAEALRLESFPDNRFDSVPLLDIVRCVEKFIQESPPAVVYTHHPADVNVDHRLVSAAVEAAVRPLASNSIGEVYSFEVPSSTEWNFLGENAFRPRVFNRLEAAHLEAKLRALQAYADEVREFPHPRSKAYLEALAKVRGAQSGFELAEAFELVYWRKGARDAGRASLRREGPR